MTKVLVVPPSTLWLDHRWSRLSSGRFASLEFSSADRHVTAVSARVQATAQDCAVCPLLRLIHAAHCLRRDPIPSSDSLILYGVQAVDRFDATVIIFVYRLSTSSAQHYGYT